MLLMYAKARHHFESTDFSNVSRGRGANVYARAAKVFIRGLRLETVAMSTRK
jgi:hypothetical protein